MVPRYLFTSNVATKIAAPAMTTTTMTAMAMRTLRMAYVLSRPRVRLDDTCGGRVCLRNTPCGSADSGGLKACPQTFEYCLPADPRPTWGEKMAKKRWAGYPE